MKKIIDFVKKYKKDFVIIFAFLMFYIILFRIFTNHGKYIFGSSIDFDKQHIQFPDYFRKLFYDTHNIFPSFAPQIGAGENIYYFSYYGLFSPLFLPSYLLPMVSMLNYCVFMMSVVVLSSTVLFYFYLRKNDYSYIICFLCSFLLLTNQTFLFQSHHHIIFVNYLPFLLLGCYGVDNFINKKNSILLIISITLMIFTSYYFSISGICALGVLFIYKYLKNLEDRFNIKKFLSYLISFIFHCFIAILISSILLVPTFYTLLNGRSVTNSYSFISNFIPKFNILYGKYSMGLMLINLVSAIYLIFFNRKKENIFLSSIILLLNIFPIFSLILNGFLYASSKVLIPFIPLSIILVAEFLNKLFRYQKFILPVLIYVVISSTLLCVISNNKELFIDKANYYTEFNNNYNEIISNITSNNLDIYRINTTHASSLFLNHISNTKEYKTTVYSSAYNKTYEDFYKNIYENPLRYRNSFMLASSSNVLYEIFMGEKYVFTKSKYKKLYSYIDTYGDLKLYENDYVLPIGYATDRIINEEEFDHLSIPDRIFNILGSVVTDKKTTIDILNIPSNKVDYQIVDQQNIKYKETSNNYIVDSLDNGLLKIKLDRDVSDKILFVIFDIEDDELSDLKVKINGITNVLTKKNWKYYNFNNKFVYTILGNDSSLLTIRFTNGLYKIKNVKLYTLDIDELKKIKTYVEPFKFDKKATKGDIIKGKINATKDSYFTFSIPYDEGFKIYVDGNKVNYEKVNKSFIGFPLSKGKHTIIMKYKAPYRDIGMIFSILGIVVFLIIIIYKNNIKRK